MPAKKEIEYRKKDIHTFTQMLDVDKKDIVSKKVLKGMPTIVLLDYERKIARKYCKNCPFEEFKNNSKEKDKTLSDKFRFCIGACPIGLQLGCIGESYIDRGTKRPYRDSLSEAEKIARSRRAEGERKARESQQF